MHSFKISVLGSGSDGNATWVEAQDGSALLVDIGFSKRDILTRIKMIGKTPSALLGILLTHSHDDHIKGVEFAREYHIPVYAADYLAPSLQNNFVVVPFSKQKKFRIKDFCVSAFSVPHDRENVGFRIDINGASLGYLTDLGCATKEMEKYLAGINALVVEFNHDVEMLKNGSYRPHLKSRILGPRGHLSNESASALLCSVLHSGCRAIFPAHISENNNTHKLALSSAKDACKKMNCSPEVHLTYQGEPTEIISVSA